MSVGPPHPELHLDKAPPRITALPYAYTAPLALVAAGALLLHWGALSLSSPWSSPTLALTHVGTLGFLTMLCAGVLPPLAAAAGDCTLPWPRLTHVVYYALASGVAGLTWGVAHARAAPVFFSIAAVGVMGVAFLTQGAWVLRRARSHGATVRGLRIALWSFFLVASLGIWLAHGHGGMQFPGPRGPWMGVHLTVGIAGWVGGMLTALCAEVLPGRLGGTPMDPRAATAIGRAIGVGVTLPVAVLLAEYFGVLALEPATLAAVAGAASLPAVVAVWGIHPLLALRALAGARESGEAMFLRTGLGLGPFVLGTGLAAAILPDPRLGVLFGWLAIVGWGAMSVYPVLISVMPVLLAAGAERRPRRASEGLLRLGFLLHVAALVVGAVAIVSGRDVLARVGGSLLVGDGVVLMVAVVQTCGGRRGGRPGLIRRGAGPDAPARRGVSRRPFPPSPG
jgi:hypothetical protein